MMTYKKNFFLVPSSLYYNLIKPFLFYVIHDTNTFCYNLFSCKKNLKSIFSLVTIPNNKLCDVLCCIFLCAQKYAFIFKLKPSNNP